MVESGQCLGLALEPFEALRVSRNLKGQDLERHPALQFRVLGDKDFTHASRAKLGFDAVVGELHSDHSVLPYPRMPLEKRWITRLDEAPSMTLISNPQTALRSLDYQTLQREDGSGRKVHEPARPR